MLKCEKKKQQCPTIKVKGTESSFRIFENENEIDRAFIATNVRKGHTARGVIPPFLHEKSKG